MIKRVLLWGCGTQSTALAVMSALGDFGLPRLDAVFYADLGWERKKTLESLEFYRRWLAANRVPVFVVDGGNIRRDGGKRHTHMPFWIAGGRMLRRECTQAFKIRPIRRALRQWLVLVTGKRVLSPGAVEQWIGFSLDERSRCGSSDVAYIVERFPLVEMGFTRQDSIDYLADKGLPVPVRSSCIGCPYRRASEYLEMRRDNSAEFEDACAFDEAVRDMSLTCEGLKAKEVFIWRGGIALRDVDLETEAARECRGPVDCLL